MTQRVKYGMLGGVLSLGAPLGLLGLRMMEERSGGRPGHRLTEELWRDRLAYGYIGLSSALVIGMFGYVLGSVADALAENADIDPLTRLYNTRRLRQELRLEIARSFRYQTALSLLMIDVDHLKPINDVHGHAVGNDALCHVASAIKATMRATDLGARIGGDEFAVLAPHTDPGEAAVLAERLRRAVDSDGGHVPTTVSIGIASVRGVEVPPRKEDDLFVAADAALYEAKQRGRNAVRTAPSYWPSHS